MMMIIKQRRRSAEKQPKSARPARLGLAVIALVCIGVAYWDLNYGGRDWQDSAAGESLAALESAEAAAEEAAAAPADSRENEAAQEEADAAVFASYRLERENGRDQELALLAEIISDPQASEQAKADAEARRQAVAETVEQEAAAESLLAARGCGETVVLVSGDRATVVCRTELDGSRASQMAQVVAETCNISFENVVIVNQ